MKDPAFLFYAQDFYTGTRTMLPKERACYLDLLIYQHQNNGIIPLDLERILMFCSGIDEATLKATLKAKFQQTAKGWLNIKLNKVVNERENYKNSQSINGKLGQFWKKIKNILSKTEYNSLQKKLRNVDKSILIDLIKQIDFKNKNTLKATLEATLQHLENEDEDENINKEENIKGGMGEKPEEIKVVEPEIIYPFDSKKFMAQWQLWKIYKKKEFGFKYKTSISQQGALKKLSDLADGNEKTAIGIIHQSISEGWKGFFELKNNYNGKSTSKNKQVQYSEDFKQEVFRKLQSS